MINERYAESGTEGNILLHALQYELLSTIHKLAITDHVVDKNHVIGLGEAMVIGREQNGFKHWI